MTQKTVYLMRQQHQSLLILVAGIMIHALERIERKKPPFLGKTNAAKLLSLLLSLILHFHK